MVESNPRGSIQFLLEVRQNSSSNSQNQQDPTSQESEIQISFGSDEEKIEGLVTDSEGENFSDIDECANPDPHENILDYASLNASLIEQKNDYQSCQFDSEQRNCEGAEELKQQFVKSTKERLQRSNHSQIFIPEHLIDTPMQRRQSIYYIDKNDRKKEMSLCQKVKLSQANHVHLKCNDDARNPLVNKKGKKENAIVQRQCGTITGPAYEEYKQSSRKKDKNYLGNIQAKINNSLQATFDKSLLECDYTHYPGFEGIYSINVPNLKQTFLRHDYDLKWLTGENSTPRQKLRNNLKLQPDIVKSYDCLKRKCKVPACKINCKKKLLSNSVVNQKSPRLEDPNALLLSFSPLKKQVHLKHQSQKLLLGSQLSYSKESQKQQLFFPGLVVLQELRESDNVSIKSMNSACFGIDDQEESKEQEFGSPKSYLKYSFESLGHYSSNESDNRYSSQKSLKLEQDFANLQGLKYQSVGPVGFIKKKNRQNQVQANQESSSNFNSPRSQKSVRSNASCRSNKSQKLRIISQGCETFGKKAEQIIKRRSFQAQLNKYKPKGNYSQQEESKEGQIKAQMSFGQPQSALCSAQRLNAKLNREGHHQQVCKILSKEAILDGNQPIFTCLDVYAEEPNEEMIMLQQMYSKTSKKQLTIVFETIGVFFHMLDPDKDQFSISERNVRQYKLPQTEDQARIDNSGVIELMSLKLNALQLQKQLIKYSNKHELIIFTSLPKNAIDVFFEQTQPNLRPYFSYIISRDDVSFQDENYLIKDCSVLLGNRELSDIIVVDSNENALDMKSLTTVILEPYQGLREEYEELARFDEQLDSMAQQQDDEDDGQYEEGSDFD